MSQFLSSACCHSFMTTAEEDEVYILTDGDRSEHQTQHISIQQFNSSPCWSQSNNGHILDRYTSWIPSWEIPVILALQS